MKPGNSNLKWGYVSITLHWLTASIVVSLFVMGLWMVELSYYDRWYQIAPHFHKSVGAILFFLTLFRLLWKLSSPDPKPVTNTYSHETKLARATHVILLTLLITVMLCGYFISTAYGSSLSIFNWFDIPATIHSYDQQEEIAGSYHLVLATCLMLTAVFHALAALKHHFFDKDQTLLRMLGK